MSARDVLLLAAETLEENPDRWMRGDMFDLPADGLYKSETIACRACAMGMINVAAYVLGERSVPAIFVANQAVRDVCKANGWAVPDGDLMHPIAEFNDDVARSAADVAAMLRKAADPRMSYDIWLEADLGGADPVKLDSLDWNYTSNCARMWRRAMPASDGLAGFDGMTAGDALAHLKGGIAAMESCPGFFREMNPSNGWGSFDSQLEALRELVAAFEEAPRAIVRVCR